MSDWILKIGLVLMGYAIHEILDVLGLKGVLRRIKNRYWDNKYVPDQRVEDTLRLGRIDTFFQIIDGNGISEIKPENIHGRLDDRILPVPPLLQDDFDRFASEQDQLKNRAETYAWNGEMAHIERFHTSRTPDREDNKLHLQLTKAHYYHFAVSNAAIYNEFTAPRPGSSLRKKLIGDFHRWRDETPPNVVCGLPVNLFLISGDERLIFSIRSTSVAIAPNEFACTVNENLHPIHDRQGHGDEVSIEALIARSFPEELGLRLPIGHRVHLLGFGVHTKTVCHSLFGYCRSDLRYVEIREEFYRNARDRGETSGLAEIPFTRKSVCRFVHEQNLYNLVGVAAIYALIHGGKASFSEIDRELKTLQSTRG